MKSAVETLSPTRVKLTVEVPFEEFQPNLDAAFTSIAQHIQVPGFRKGKVPNRIIEQRVGRAAVLEEAVNSALPAFYGRALEENKVVPLGQPDVEVERIPATDGEDFAFTAEVDCRPEVTVPDYSTIVVEVDPVAVDQGAVADRLDGLRHRFGTLKAVDRPAQEGDFLTISLTATIEDEEIDSASDLSYEVGSKNFLDGLDEAVTGLTAGESKTFSAELAGGERLGETAECTVTVQTVKERELPELDDDFAQTASEFDTLDELKEDIAKQVGVESRYQQGMQARDKVLDALRELVDIPVPDGIVEEEVNRHLEGEGRLEDDEHRAEVTTNSRQAFATQFLLDAIVEQEKVTVEQSDFVEYLVMTAQQYGMDPNEFAKLLDQQGQIPMVVQEVARRKALAHVLEQVTVKDTDGNVVDLSLTGEGETPEDAETPEGAEGDESAEDQGGDHAEDKGEQDA